METLIVCYLLFGVPMLVRSLMLLGANIYRAGQTNAAPPPLMELPSLPPRFKVAMGNGKHKRDDNERLPDV